MSAHRKARFVGLADYDTAEAVIEDGRKGRRRATEGVVRRPPENVRGASTLRLRCRAGHCGAIETLSRQASRRWHKALRRRS